MNDFCLPKDTAAIAAQMFLSHKSTLHPGLLMDRFPTETHIKDQKNQKPHLDHIVKVGSWPDYKATIKHLQGGDDDIFCVKSRSRIASHLSRAGGLENANCCLHPVYGFAYLPGSGLKGLAAAYAWHLKQTLSEQDQKPFQEEVQRIFGWGPGSPGVQDLDNDDMQAGEIIFHDAFATEPPKLEVDVLTCHYPGYYQNGYQKVQAPGDWMSPVPVTFLTIAAGTTFRFKVTRTHASVPKDLLEAAKRLLLGGLHWLGTGAKTAAGYGWFDGEEDPEWLKKREALAKEKLEQEARKNAAEQLVQVFKTLKTNEVLWLPDSPNPMEKDSKFGHILSWDGTAWTKIEKGFFKKEGKSKSKVWKLLRTNDPCEKPNHVKLIGPIEDTQCPDPFLP